MRVELKIPITLDFIKNAVNAMKSTYRSNAVISHISTDTRELSKGDLFIPLNGENFNGENFLCDAVSLGAYTLSALSDICDIKVKDTSLALLDIASAYKKLFSLKETIAITGSVGKSTTKNLTCAILSSKYKVHATEGNFNNEIGVPMTVLSAPQNTEIMIIEAGMNHSGELRRISSCIRPTLSVITKIGTAHLGNLGSREGIAKAKSEIFDGMSTLRGLIPYKEPLLYGIANAKTVSTAYPDADFYLSVLSQSSSGAEFDFSSELAEIKSASLPPCGSHIPECLAFALATALSVGMNKNEIIHALSFINAPLLSPKSIKINGITVIDDSYNASLESVISALKTLKSYPCNIKSALIGDILELGKESGRIHRTVGKLCAEARLERLYTYGNYAEEIAEGASDAGFPKEKIFINRNIGLPYITAEQIVKNSVLGEVILFKASNKIRLSHITELIENISKGY